jgi:hypothetical protein
MSRIGNMIKTAQHNLFKNYTFTLNSRPLLYFVLFLTMGDLIYFSIDGDMLFIFIYLAVGYLTSFFSKNMIVIMVIAMTVTHILRLGKIGQDSESPTTKSSGFGKNEGMENHNGSTDPIADFQEMKEEYNLNELSEPFTDSQDETKKETGHNIKTPSASVTVPGPSTKKTPVAAPVRATNNAVPMSASVPMSNTPSPANALKKATSEIERIKKELVNSTAKQDNVANGPINSDMLKMLGIENSPSIKNDNPIVNSGFDNLDTQTQKLLNTQKELMTNMENLSPLLAQAEKFMDKFKGLSQ